MHPSPAAATRSAACDLNHDPAQAYRSSLPTTVFSSSSSGYPRAGIVTWPRHFGQSEDRVEFHPGYPVSAGSHCSKTNFRSGAPLSSRFLKP